MTRKPLTMQAKRVLRALLRDEIRRAPGANVLAELSAWGVHVQRQHPLHEPPLWYLVGEPTGVGGREQTDDEVEAHARGVLEAQE